MSFFRNLNVGAKLTVGFGLLLVALMGVGGFAIYQTGQINGHVTAIATHGVPSIVEVNELRDVANRLRRKQYRYVLSETDRELDDTAAAVVGLVKTFDGLLVKYESSVSSPQARKAYDQLKKDVDAYWTVEKTLLGLFRGGEKSSAQARKYLGGDSLKSFEKVQAGLAALATAMKAEVEADYAGSQETYGRIYSVLIALLTGAVALAAVMGLMITRMITGPLRVAVDVARRVAAGDLTSVVEVRSKDETGQLMAALKEMNTNLGKIVGQVRNGTDSIATASKQIAAGNADLSQRTEEQASSLEETASSMEELTSTVKQNAENAMQANQLAAGASLVAVKGGNVVGQVVTTMSSINESSKKIVDIISVIDGIAFQTNILALNAAVEAARAGEQGRGFAVVASEVRTLAQRSAAAAKEIKELISDSVSKVEDGTKLVGEAGSTMDEIVTSVKRVTDIMAEITAASQEQSEGIGQVNTAVAQMDEVTQQNAALVEEAAAAAESMQEQAQSLAQAISTFRLSETQMSFQQAPGVELKRPKSTSHAPSRPKAAAPRSAKPAPRAEPRVAATAGGDDEWSEF